MNYYGMSRNVYDGKILSTGYGGTLYAYDAKTGDLLWTYNATNIGHESPYGENYPLSIAAVCDGKVYLFSSEHSPTKPLWRGSYLRCVNITDGTELWKLLHYIGFSGAGIGVADGYIVSASTYDNLIYCIGKGPSAVTVTASPEVSVHGSSVLVKGTVTDQSPGAKKIAAKLGSDVAAVADENMQALMEYLYEQQAMPTDAQGVEVVLSVLDSNGNYRDIGTATSNTDGFYSFNWQPDIEGKYTVYASFGGSKSYYPSHAVTAFQVDPAPAATVAPTPAPASIADQYFLPMSVGMIAALIAVGVLVVLLLLRKR
jgi:outer membrane protein assembly factor BamB